MKKLILKTAIITFCIAVVLAICVFGVVSFCAPAVMMRFTASLGMENVSGDYAYQGYGQTQDIAYLARSFEIAARNQDDQVADGRFDELIAHEEFEAYCAEQSVEGLEISYRDYIFASGVCVKYRLARTDEEKEEICELALQETARSFPSGNPALMLAVEAAQAEDGAVCHYLLEKLPLSEFEENDDYLYILTVLEEAASNE